MKFNLTGGSHAPKDASFDFANSYFDSVSNGFPTSRAGGPPLLCHPFDINNARSLPWSGSEWRGVDKNYNINRLVDDTLGLLAPETPVMVRMETLRRATVYAVWSLNDYKVGYSVKDARSQLNCWRV
jgi:hypothetical protein